MRHNPASGALVVMLRSIKIFGIARIVWLFSVVLGHSRFIFARYVMHQDLQTLLRCHMQAFAALGGVRPKSFMIA